MTNLVHTMIDNLARQYPDDVLDWVKDNIICMNNPYDEDELGWA